MSEKTIMSDSEREALEARAIEMYLNKIPVTEISAQLGIDKFKVYGIFKKRGVECTNGGKRKRGKAECICPHCKSQKNPKGAKFCCMCGKDIRSEEEQLADELGALPMKISAFFPVSDADAALVIIYKVQRFMRAH